jgi:hypothetical protein
MKKQKELSSPRLRTLRRDLKKIEKGQKYLLIEGEKLRKEKEKVRIKIKKEKKLLSLKNQIKNLRNRK